MSDQDPHNPDQTHPDPAVQALIDAAWLGQWDVPVTVDDLVTAARLVRAAGTGAVSLPTEWAVNVTFADGKVKTTTAENEEHAAVVADSMATYLDTLNAPTRIAFGATKVEIVSRRSEFLPGMDARLIHGWRHVRDGRAFDFDDVAKEMEAGRG
ncbi:hypothetical protein BDK92_7200 [Micromonospora pisi]|uniref:Uncharacterized protein n=1 Tax=Micromonospora pisi TaxID=589240 RepID=A0A495JWJ1_9ACTN|nr:hypothetical protein [Micromonospora pisi]RKR92722.1 hypothetical protein BDK92_7200 [Micromonospora pisi]